MLRSSNPQPLQSIRLTWRAAGALALPLVAASWYLLFTAPVIVAQQSLAQRRLAIQQLQASGPQTLTKLAEATQAAEDGREAIEKLQARIPTMHDEARFLHWVSQQASHCELSVRDFRPVSKQLHGDYESQTLMLSATGPYEGIAKFLDQLRDCPRMNRITNLEIAPLDADRNNYSLTIQTLLFMKTKSAANSPAPTAG